jgi:hypothetical protein
MGDNQIRAARSAIEYLTDEERLVLFAEWCAGCGRRLLDDEGEKQVCWCRRDE